MGNSNAKTGKSTSNINNTQSGPSYRVNQSTVSIGSTDWEFSRGVQPRTSSASTVPVPQTSYNSNRNQYTTLPASNKNNLTQEVVKPIPSTSGISTQNKIHSVDVKTSSSNFSRESQLNRTAEQPIRQTSYNGYSNQNIILPASNKSKAPQEVVKQSDYKQTPSSLGITKPNNNYFDDVKPSPSNYSGINEIKGESELNRPTQQKFGTTQNSTNLLPKQNQPKTFVNTAKLENPKVQPTKKISTNSEFKFASWTEPKQNKNQQITVNKPVNLNLGQVKMDNNRRGSNQNQNSWQSNPNEGRFKSFDQSDNGVFEREASTDRNRGGRNDNSRQYRGRPYQSASNNRTSNLNAGTGWEQSNNYTADANFQRFNSNERGESMDRNRGGFMDRNRGGQRGNFQRNGRFQRNANNQATDHNIPSSMSVGNNEGPARRGNHFRNRPPRKIGFKKMEYLLAKEADDIMIELRQIKNEFDEFLGSDITPDCIVLSLHVFTKMSFSSFIENLSEVLKIIAASRYMEKLMLFVYNLSDQTDEEKRRNKHFWNGVHEFWLNLSVFCINVIDKMPATGQDIIPKILKAVIQTIPSFEEKYHIMIQEDVKKNFENIQLRLAKLSEKRMKPFIKKSEEQEDEEDPPDDFRDIQIYPLPHELLHDDEVFLRKNKIEGKYNDVDHYLDVQFRLLREDFVRPLRKGIQEYLAPDHKKRLSNIKVYKDVTCIRMEKTQSQMGFLIQVFKKGKIKNAERSRRFMFGALVCFTPDNFKTITFGKILDRKLEYLRAGQILVGFENNAQFNPDIMYTMVECTVYFEPYYQVLKALQNMQTHNFPLKRYLVDVEHEREFPDYVTEEKYFKIDKRHDVNLTDTYTDWSKLGLTLNKSQIEAFKNALSSKFSIIQGPPGTGKTYLGLEIARTLILNKDAWSEHRPMLVICFTNHALDQFLEGLLSTTTKIVRVGGQSKNENLTKYNIRNLRTHKDYNMHGMDRHMFYETRDKMKCIGSFLHKWNEIYAGMVNCDTVFDPIIFLNEDNNLNGKDWFTSAGKDSFLDWLLQIPSDYQQAKQHTPIANEELDDVENIDQFDYQADNNILDIDDEDLHMNIVSEHACRKYVELKFFLDHIARIEKRPDFHDMRSENYYELRMFHQKAIETYEYLKFQFDTLRNLLKNDVEIPLPTNVDYKNPKNLRCEIRWQLYGHWVQNLMKKAVENIKKYDEQFRLAYIRYNEVCDIVDTRIMETNVVLGMTTTGAARLQRSLQTLKCPIVIVEEAAEVLESHVITSLTENCQHLILIGDHKQLKPSTADYNLDVEFNLGISLFERMVRNNMHCDRLNVQHRMRPEIARLVCPTIYDDLENHESVHVYPDVRGVDKSLFFINHEVKELEASDNSKENHHESKYLILLARYLILNDYEPEQITILVAYSGQFFACLEEKRKYDILKDVKICVLDNYQGEENDIILLSLVRNNDDGVIGFLKLENRVCVALSRAKQGLFIMGNISLLANNSTVWKPIKDELYSMDAIGDSLILKCQNHKNQTYIKNISDFQKVSEGGCSQACNMFLDCGHYCPKICHTISHDTMKCFQDCSRILCEKNHQCPKKCYEECGECIFPVEALLPCGHTNFIPCFQKVDDVKCHTDVYTVLPCGHSADKPCYMTPEKFQCPFFCETRIEPCGHSCLKKCHYFEDPNHISYLCKKTCERANKDCSLPESGDHKCKKSCYEECKPCDILVKKFRTVCEHVFLVACCQNVDELTCEKPCKRKLACGHNCKLKCHEPCSTYECKIMVDKKIKECGHTVKFMCYREPTKSVCKDKCEKILPCGHKCQLKCKDVCSSKFCKDLVRSNIQSPCGHPLDVPCYLRNVTTISSDLLSFCKAKCNATLDCEHTCSGTCGECSQGRIHKDCQENCKNIFVCGHECTVSCRSACLPCQRPCTYRCIHSKCSKRCGAPCTQCVESCQRKCQHGACKAKCFEKCTIEPCMEPCHKLLKCGHPCIGYCGDPCPPLCRICDKEEVTDIFFGTEDEEDARFVYLHDCKHVVESEGLEQFFLQNSGNNDREITTICCPKCKTQITQIQRYSDLLKESFKDIQRTKQIIYGGKRDNDDHQKRLFAQGNNIKAQYNMFLKGNSPIAIKWLSSVLEELNSSRKNKSAAISKQELQSLETKLQIFNNIMTNTSQFEDLSMTGNQLLLPQINYLIKSLNDCKSMTKQKITDFEKELNRLKRIKELASMEKAGGHLKEFKNCSELALSFKPYNNADDALLKKLLIDLNEKSKSGLKISEKERAEILQAMQLTKGHWFKCQNGHIYAIGECGGATQESKCPECKMSIGGSNHTLNPTNTVATEMDGAVLGAFDEQALLFNLNRHHFI